MKAVRQWNKPDPGVNFIQLLHQNLYYKPSKNNDFFNAQFYEKILGLSLQKKTTSKHSPAVVLLIFAQVSKIQNAPNV